jgi:hypothetical protein
MGDVINRTSGFGRKFIRIALGSEQDNKKKSMEDNLFHIGP